eukprot:g31660.t1
MCAETQLKDAVHPPKADEDTQGLMVIDLGLELHRRAKVFALAGDTLRAKALIESSIDQLGTAKVLCSPQGRILHLLETLLEAWNTEGVVLQASFKIEATEDNDLVLELERSVAEGLRQVSKAPVVAAAAKLVLGGCGTTPSTSSDTTSARGEHIPLDPKSGGLLSAAAAAAEARIDDGCSGVDWEDGSRISSDQPTPRSSPPPSELEVAMEPAMHLPNSDTRVAEYKTTAPADDQLDVKTGEAMGGPPGRPNGTFELIPAAQVADCPSPQKQPRCFFGLCGRNRGKKGALGSSRAQCPLRLARDFHRGDLLGAGSYGCVFAARRKTTGEIVAEMLLDRAGRTKEERSDRLVRLTRELRLCEQLEHPFIVSYYGHEFVMGAQGGPEKLHLFLEYCSGGSLAAPGATAKAELRWDELMSCLRLCQGMSCRSYLFCSHKLYHVANKHHSALSTFRWPRELSIQH